MKPFTIAQISDLHIGSEQEGELRNGTDVRANFRSVLGTLDPGRVSLIVLSGDLCHHEQTPGIYRWIRGELEATGIPYLVMSGNHDESAVLAGAFGMENDLHGRELYGERLFPWGRILFLDSSTDSVSERQLSWLAEKLVQDPPNGHRASLVFIHHPPVHAGARFMDATYPLRNRNEVRQVLSRSPRSPQPVFCGHYHTETTVCAGSLVVHITPSLYYQIDREPETLTVEHRIPGWRLITVDGSAVTSTVRYLWPGLP